MPDKKQTVLIVEDSPSNAKLIASLLKDICHTVLAESGEQALATAIAVQPDLILLDVILPGIDGYQVCAHLKNHPDTVHIPIIFLTSRSDQEDEARGLAMGAIDYISKPIKPAILGMRVRNHLELKRRGDLLASLAHIDALTGIANRRRFEEHLQSEWKRALREKKTLSLLMLDIDHFKLFNDQYGHPEGDTCLRKVAEVLHRQCQRGGDLVARYGGEEFVLVLPNCDKDGAMRIAQNMITAVAGLALPHAASATATHITVSVGVAATEDGYTSLEQLLEYADKQLYRAKQNGRNTFSA